MNLLKRSPAARWFAVALIGIVLIALPFALDARDSLALTFIDGASGCDGASNFASSALYAAEEDAEEGADEDADEGGAPLGG